MCANEPAARARPSCAGRTARRRCALASETCARCAEPAPTGRFRIVVRYRPSCLTLARGLLGLEAALQKLDALRSLRFHDRDAVFIIHERTRQPVDELAARASLAGPASGG